MTHRTAELVFFGLMGGFSLLALEVCLLWMMEDALARRKSREAGRNSEESS